VHFREGKEGFLGKFAGEREGGEEIETGLQDGHPGIGDPALSQSSAQHRLWGRKDG